MDVNKRRMEGPNIRMRKIKIHRDLYVTLHQLLSE